MCTHIYIINLLPPPLGPGQHKKMDYIQVPYCDGKKLKYGGQNADSAQIQTGDPRCGHHVFTPVWDSNCKYSAYFPKPNDCDSADAYTMQALHQNFMSRKYFLFKNQIPLC